MPQGDQLHRHRQLDGLHKTGAAFLENHLTHESWGNCHK